MAEEKWYELESIPNRHSDKDYLVNIDIPEFTCVCPKTGLPDFATIYIEYVPNELLIELKALKYYILNYRNMGTFHEDVTNRILNDLVECVKPRSMEVIGDFSPRGGIKTVVTASWDDSAVE